MTDLEACERARLACGRSCGSCSLCCKLLGISALGKPQGKWCGHCKPGRGCTIHADRPDECRTFYCAWLVGTVPAEWYPASAKFIVVTYEDAGADVHCVTVDPAYPNRWRDEPFYSQIKRAAAESLRTDAPVPLVRIGRRYLAIYPSCEVDIGEVESGVRFPPDRVAAMRTARAAELRRLQTLA